MPDTPPRIAGFDYRGPRRYFITVCTASRLRWLADPSLATELTVQIPLFFGNRGFAVLVYCLMPDHVHLLLEGTTEDADLVSAVETEHGILVETTNRHASLAKGISRPRSARRG